MEKKFTKGKWICNEKKAEVISEHDCSNNGGIDIIAQCYCGFNVENTTHEAMANAVLISAAPDMLTALNDLLIYCRSNSTSQLEPLIRNAENAIKKANTLSF